MALSSVTLKDFNESLLPLLECPICTVYMTTSPILLCENGHNVCSSCREKIEKCPTCKGDFTGGRNIVLQDLAGKVFYPCKYHEEGCEQRILLSDIEDHKRTCPYRVYYCLMCNELNTAWKGKRNDIRAHIEDQHKDKTWMKGNDITLHFENFDINKDGSYCQILFAHDEMFWYMNRCVSAIKMFYISVHYIGPSEKCTNFLYEVEYASPDKKRKSVFRAPTHPDYENIDSMIEQRDCSRLTGKDCKYFTMPNKTLECKLQIIKDNVRSK